MSEQRQHETHIIEATVALAEPEGREWDVTIIGAESLEALVMVDGQECVKSKNGRLYACDALRASAPLWEGVQVYDNHQTDEQFEASGGMRSVLREGLGAIVDVRWDEALRKLIGTLKIADDAAARKLKNYHEAGILDTIGLSIDTIPDGRQAYHEGKRTPLITGFQKILSVDLVANPAAGGGFNRIIAATQHQEATMSEENRAPEQVPGEEPAAPVAPSLPPELIEQVRALVKEMIADALAGSEPEPAAEEAEEQPTDQDQAPEADSGLAQKVAQLESKIVVNDKLEGSKLPEDAQEAIRKTIGNRVVTGEEVDRMIESTRGLLASRDASGQVQGAGHSTIRVGTNEEDNINNEILRLVMGNMPFRGLESRLDAVVDLAGGVPKPHDRMIESYKSWRSAGRVHGGYRKLSELIYDVWGDLMQPSYSRRASEAATTSNLSSVVKNAMNVLLGADFSARHQWWAPIVSEEELDTIDSPTLVRWYGIGTLSDVAEGNAYTEIELTDEEETAAFIKRGNYVGVTIETLLRDKVNKIREIPQMLADSWYNTLSNQVATVFTTYSAAGPVLGDTGALFNSTAVSSAGGHANLLTTALSLAAYSAARTAMRKQTTGYLGAGVRALITPAYMLVPVDLEQTARTVMETEQLHGSANNDINPYAREAQVIVVPEWTDSNNWALVADPNQFPAIYMLYLRGNRVPELFEAGDETSGAMFTNDELRYKVRQMSFYFSSTYTCAPVADYRPVHKSNVS